MNRLSGLLFVLLASCDRGGAVSAERQVSFRVDGRSNANPSMAARGDFVGVAWSASTANATDVYAVMSRDGGRTFSAPVQVNQVPGDARINSELPPRIALVANASGGSDVVVVWTTKRGDSTRIQWARSADGGATFSAATPVPGSVGRGSRGWQSIAVDSAGKVFVLWLDHRDVTPMAAAHHHGASSTTTSATKEDPTERAGPSKLYFASLADTAPTVITGSVCYCCKTSLVASGSNVYGVWRHVYPGTHRNIAFTQSHDGGRTFAAPVQVSDDHWAIDGCPENGPAIAVDNRIHVAWATPPDGKSDTPLGVFYASSNDGTSFDARVQMPTRGAGSHAQIVSEGNGSLVIAWDEIIGAERQVAVARLTSGTNGPPKVTRLWGSTRVAGGWPILSRTSSSTLVGWVSKSGTSSEIVVTPLK